MSNHHPLLVVLFILVLLPLYSTGTHYRTLLQNVDVPCPLNFELARGIVDNNHPSLDAPNACRYARQGLYLAQADYLHRTGSFVPPLNTTKSCWRSFQSFAQRFSPNINLQRNCGYQTNSITVPGCMNITNRKQYETLVDRSLINAVLSTCSKSDSGFDCTWCTVALSNIHASYFTGTSVGNLTNCAAYTFIYSAAFISHFGPTDRNTPICLFAIDIDFTTSKHKHKTVTVNIVIIAVIVVTIIIVSAISIGIWYCRRKKLNRKRRTRSNAVSALDALTESTTLIKFNIQDIKEATRNFSRENIIGRGGFGNVYKGVLPDDSEVAFKVFKNCSAAGDESFAHEVEVIASVRHVNLVDMRGYCIAATPFEGYQRIIVTDLVKNGSLYDHLFRNQSTQVNLSWPIRRNIALGMARGIAYLHHGAQPAIIHRDIKASNILLDENFEAKVADFGLAKFAPEGVTHLSTRVAGTMGYVAPEYALYGQLTERSDVYSFGVVLLELLSGRKALLGVGDDQPDLLADWAWSMVQNGTPLEVIDAEMAERGPPEVMEKYVMVAVLSSHSPLYARPTMDKVLKMLESDLPVPSIPERSIPLSAGIRYTEKPISNSGPGHLSNSGGYYTCTIEMDGR